MVSKEYGAWASILTAFLVGVAIAKEVNYKSFFLFFGSLSLFLARIPFLSIVRLIFDKNSESVDLSRKIFWFIVYSFVGISSFAVLLFKYKLNFFYIFLILATIVFSYNIYVTYTKGKRALESSISGVLGVSLISSFAYYVTLDKLDNIVYTLWILVFLYLLNGILYVDFRFGVIKWHSSFIFNIAIISIITVLAILRYVPTLLVLAYIPSFSKTIIGGFSQNKVVIPKKLGRLELLHSTIFIILTVLIY